MTRDRQETLPGVPLPPAIEAPLSDEAIKSMIKDAVREGVAEAFRPYAEMWTRRGQDMLDVLAEATHSRVEVRSSVRTIRATSWLVVLLILAASAASWAVLDRERIDRRRNSLIREQRQEERLDDFGRRLDRACRPPALN